jgi:putative hemolysin
MEILVILILILLNGIFSMSEISLVSSRKNRLESASKKGSAGAKIALELASSPNRFLSTVQIGITLIGILTGMFSGENITKDLEIKILQFPVLQDYAHTLAVSIVLIAITFFSLVLGELVPKRIGLTYPETIAKLISQPMKMISIGTAPFIWLLTQTTELILKLLRIRPSSDNKVTEEEIKAIIREGIEDGEVQKIEQDILERVFYIGDRKVSSLMTHRSSMTFLESGFTKQQVKQTIMDDLHSIYPVYEKNPDNIVGVVSLINLFVNIDSENFNINSLLQEPIYITETTSAYKALEKFKKTNVHYALVTDEYGMLQGIVTLDNILKALVGNVSEFNQTELKLEKRDDGSWLVDGHYPLHDFLIYFELDELVNEYEINTISGLILNELSHIPKEGEKLKWRNFELEIMDMDGVKIDKVMIRNIN